jgi:hypothetical protein
MGDFILQTNTALHETDTNFAFMVAPNLDLFAIKKNQTGTGSTEVAVLSAADKYQKFILQTGTPLHETDSNFEFLLANNLDIFAIKKSKTDTKSTEIAVLSAASNYQTFILQTGTPLHETDDNFQFLLTQNRDLMGIKKNQTGTGSTEICVLSAKDNYQTFSLQTGTPQHETNQSFEFAAAANNDLFIIKKNGTGTGTTEVSILSAASKYQQYILQTGTGQHETAQDFTFKITPDRNLFGVKKHRTGSGSTEVHIVKIPEPKSQKNSRQALSATKKNM